MKTFLTIFLLSILQHTNAQISNADSIYTILMATARPAVKTWVNNTAVKYKNKDINETLLKATENF